jgi:hypothetical protein
MANLAYCRFSNTLEDLKRCHENIGNTESEEEQEAERKLIALCKRIAEEN